MWYHLTKGHDTEYGSRITGFNGRLKDLLFWTKCELAMWIELNWNEVEWSGWAMVDQLIRKYYFIISFFYLFFFFVVVRWAIRLRISSRRQKKRQEGFITKLNGMTVKYSRLNSSYWFWIIQKPLCTSMIKISEPWHHMWKSIASVFVQFV